MQVTHRGLTIDLEDDDPRVAIFEAVLFGRTLPPPLPAPGVQQAEMPEKWRQFWHAIDDTGRLELKLLSERRWRAEELEKALGLKYTALRGQHLKLHRAAQRFRLPLRVRAVGRVRKDRSYALSSESIDFVRRLVQPTPSPATMAP